MLQLIYAGLELDVNQWRKVIENDTMEDAIKMALLVILLIIGGIADGLRGL
jgi:hypothetical protein